MVSKSNLIFSKIAASRLLSVDINLIADFRIFFRVCWVWIRGSRPRFISKRLFTKHFSEHRQQQGRQLTAKAWPEVPDWYTVENTHKGTSYPVVLNPSGPDCDCEDYRNQIAILGKGVCKHGYAVLSKLGFGSLSAYLAA
ncbi:MAG: hypothetical protein F6K11_23270 [Leptolyngbya sp. SIO3F4]|nr:hypothetical protein [Leptolyngbya sp. SIO3F4]